MKQVSFDADTKTQYYARFTFDLSFYILVRQIIFNIIFGIIIDTFAEQREIEKEIMKDKQNHCFICGI